MDISKIEPALYGTTIVLVGGFLTFLPIIVAEARSRRALMIAALLLSLIAAGIVGWSAGMGIGGVLAMPAAASCWFAGLFCGLMAYMDAAADRREREATFRLLHNEARGLPVPAALKAKG